MLRGATTIQMTVAGDVFLVPRLTFYRVSLGYILLPLPYNSVTEISISQVHEISDPRRT